MSNEIASLQEKAFKAIVNEFSKFISAYYSTKNVDLKRNFHFLQRVYSHSILTELEKTGKLEAEHLEFLLNEHLKKVNIGLLLNFISPDAIIDKIKSIGSSITELSFIEEEYSLLGTIQPLLPHVYNVTKVCIPNICTDEILRSIAASCPHLTELDIHESTAVSNEGLMALCVRADNVIQAQCPLRIIDLSIICGINEGIAFILKYIPTLEEVNCITLPDVLYCIHKLDGDIENNEIKHYNLTNIDFSHYDGEFLLESLKLCSKLCPHLKRITVSISRPEELEVCTLFTELENVILHCYVENRPTIDFNDFLCLRGGKLKLLILDHFTLSVSTLMQKCPNLNNLSLERIDFQQPDRKAIKFFKYLQFLQLNTFKFTDNFCAESIEMLLNSSPNLEVLSMRTCEFRDPEISARLLSLSSNTNLKYLSFCNTEMDIDLLQQVIINCSSLQTLSLEYCDTLSEEDVEMLRQTIASSHKKIEILWNDDRSDFSYHSDFDFDFYDHDLDDDEYTDYDYVADYWDSDDYGYYYEENEEY